MLLPWAIRYAFALGAPVMLRSNFGLELAIGNHAAALSDAPPERVYADRLAAVHPLNNLHGAAALRRAGGEVPYFRQLGDEARSWIADHPTGFARLTAHHLRQFFWADAWEMMFDGRERNPRARALLVGLVDVAGLVAIAFGARRGESIPATAFSRSTSPRLRCPMRPSSRPRATPTSSGRCSRSPSRTGRADWSHRIPAPGE